MHPSNLSAAILPGLSTVRGKICVLERVGTEKGSDVKQQGQGER